MKSMYLWFLCYKAISFVLQHIIISQYWYGMKTSAIIFFIIEKLNSVYVESVV